MDAFLQKVIEQREREQRKRDFADLTRPKCERCGVHLLGARAHRPAGERICSPCGGKK